MQHWLIPQQGSLIPWEAASSENTFPTALLYGYSVYTSFRASLQEPWRQRHLERLSRDAQALSITCSYSVEQMLQAISEFTSPESVVRLTLFPVIEHFSDLFQSQEHTPSQLLLSVSSYAPPDSRPLKLVCQPHRNPMTGVKRGGLAGDFLPRRKAVQAGYDDVLWVDAEAPYWVREASTSNVVGIKEKTVFLFDELAYPPPALWAPSPARGEGTKKEPSSLQGITREAVAHYALELGFQLDENPVSLKDLATLDGLFLTNSVGGIRRVESLRSLTNETLTISWPPQTVQHLQALQQKLAVDYFKCVAQFYERNCFGYNDVNVKGHGYYEW